MKSHLTFSEALEAAKQGKRISREGWNGKGMFVSLNKGSCNFESVQGVPSPESITHIEGIKREHFEHGDTGTVTRLPNLDMKAATGSTVRGWLASQTDLLAEDWCILD